FPALVSACAPATTRQSSTRSTLSDARHLRQAGVLTRARVWRDSASTVRPALRAWARSAPSNPVQVPATVPSGTQPLGAYRLIPPVGGHAHRREPPRRQKTVLAHERPLDGGVMRSSHGCSLS